MTHDEQLRLIVGNAARLFRDADLLLDHGRYASAFALALLGVEEIGKALLKWWEEERPLPKPRRSESDHIQKQTAVASLLTGALLVRMSPKPLDPNTVDAAAVIKAFSESEEGLAFAAIRVGDLEKRKQNALYQDDDMLTAVEDDFAKVNVGSLFRIASEAQEALANRYALDAGRAFYESVLKHGFRAGDAQPYINTAPA
jgi:AbiV family abortive infection protein